MSSSGPGYTDLCVLLSAGPGHLGWSDRNVTGAQRRNTDLLPPQGW